LLLRPLPLALCGAIEGVLVIIAAVARTGLAGPHEVLVVAMLPRG
jgi:hypothetical protein